MCGFGFCRSNLHIQIEEKLFFDQNRQSCNNLCNFCDFCQIKFFLLCNAITLLNTPKIPDGYEVAWCSG